MPELVVCGDPVEVVSERQDLEDAREHGEAHREVPALQSSIGTPATTGVLTHDGGRLVRQGR
jgi:hypothetical protein